MEAFAHCILSRASITFAILFGEGITRIACPDPLPLSPRTFFWYQGSVWISLVLPACDNMVNGRDHRLIALLANDA